jgi:CRISPR-associated protein Csm3
MQCLNRLIEGLKLLEKDALGGSGSRGYGKIRFRNLAVDGKSIQEKFDAIREVKLEAPAVIVEG